VQVSGLRRGGGEDALDEHAGQVHLVGVECAGLDEFFDLGDRDPPGMATKGLKFRAERAKTRLP
jgi:hypothetical protein